MIQKDYILEWSKRVPWKSNNQIEQDLIIERALVELFSDSYIKANLAFRGGTALHKLYLKPQPRYSEDIDLVQIHPIPFGEGIDHIRSALAFLGNPRRLQKERNNTLVFYFETEFQPVQKLKLKVETNCREHFTVLGYREFPFQVQSAWFNGRCNITTYQPEELLATKLRALYQRRKGRDLFDLFIALMKLPNLDKDLIINCYREYMQYVVESPPNQKNYLENLEEKMLDDEFIGDTTALIAPNENYNPFFAFKVVKAGLIEKI